MKSNPPPSRVPAKRSYPHIQDLIARTNGLHQNNRASIKAWLDAAQLHWHQAKSQLAFGSLDTALVDYLLALTIVIQIIPSCREYPTFKNEAGPLYRQYEILRKSLNEKHPEFEQVKEDIKKDNVASGVLSVHQLAQQSSSAQPIGLSSGSANAPSQSKASQSTPLGDQTSRPGSQGNPLLQSEAFRSSGTEHTNRASDSPKVPPVPSTAIPESDLQARFQHLRINSPRSSSPGSHGDSTVRRSSPLGPRDMPRRLPQLDMNALPQMPAPTYSPSTSFGSPGGLPPPRNNVRAPALRKPVPGSGSTLPQPGETSLSVDKLFDLLRADSDVSILLLDIRQREEFDQGHIFARSVVCVEPISLRDGMSGDELEQTFVLASRYEQETFQRREQFDFVVYYDQSSSNTKFLEATPQSMDSTHLALRTLHLALYDYAYGQHRLRRPPLLLLGGLDSWVQLVGPQALQTTRGSTVVQSSHAPNGFHDRTNVYRAGIPRRVPAPQILQQQASENRLEENGIDLPTQFAANGNRSNGNIPYPIDIEEEQKWMESLHSQKDLKSVTAPSQDARKHPNGMSNASIGPGSYPRTKEEFFQRYPAVSRVQDMSVPSYSSSSVDGQLQSLRHNTIIDHPFHGFTDVRNPEFHPPSPPIRPPPVAPRKSYSGVSERFAPPLRPLSASGPERPPKIAPYSSSFAASLSRTENTGIPTTGLKNLGNTCYMNSILQCMSGTIPLSRYFLDGSYKHHINKNNPLGSEGLLAEAFAGVVRHLWAGQYKFISPVTLKDVSGRLNEMFRNNDQQDAQEFLEFLLDGLHEDLNPNANRTKLKPLSEEEEQRREQMPSQKASNLEWDRYLHQNSSVVVNWLQGQLRSRLKCLTCGVTSTTYSPFMYLSLPIPSHAHGQFTLDDCLREFVKEEVLENDDAWNCPKCKVPRRSTKTLTIMRLPIILIIHLKRFTNKGRWRDKLTTTIQFPLRELDFSRYAPTLLTFQSQTNGIQNPRSELTPPFIYNVYGIVNHYGSLNSGHYTAVVRNAQKETWTLFDDSRVSGIEGTQVVSSNAYVLFLVRNNIQ